MSSRRHFSHSSNFRRVVRFLRIAKIPFFAFVDRNRKRKDQGGLRKELELRTLRLLALESVRQESRCLTRASSSIRCRLAFLRGRPGVYKYDIPRYAKQCRCIIDHASHTRCCSYFKTFPIWNTRRNFDQFRSNRIPILWNTNVSFFFNKGRGEAMDFKLIEFQEKWIESFFISLWNPIFTFPHSNVLEF